MAQLSSFADTYLNAWTELDDARRRQIVETLWAPTGTLSVSSLGSTLTGHDEIAAHLSRVHADLIATKGMTFSYDQELTSGETTLLRWSMTAPDGTVVGRGVDTIVLDVDGRAQQICMFMGVD